MGFVVASLLGLAVATGYVLLLDLLSYPSTPGIDGEDARRTPDRPDDTPQDDGGGSTGTATNEWGEAASSATTTTEASDDEFGWADVEAEE